MMVCSGLVALECLAAILFVGDFLQEQIESIQMNSTLVETYQRTHGERTNFWDHWSCIFGDNRLHWPWPYVSCREPDYMEPAIPDDADADNVVRWKDDEDSLGIAGSEYEGVDSTMPQNAGGARSGMSAPRPRNRYESAE